MADKGTYRTRIRYGGTCFVCGQAVPKGVEGWYDSARRKVACGTHELATEFVAASVTSEPAQPSSPVESDGLPRLIKAKYVSTCTVCGAEMVKGADMFWVPGTRVVVCPPCTAGEVAAGLDGGTAGRAATRIADGATRKHAERLLAAYPMLGEHLIANARPTSNMHAWMRGADGERIVGRKLDIAAQEGRIVVLHDRRLPFGGNIDHLVIGPRRISVIDAKNYSKARITKQDDTLMVGGKSAEHLIDGVRHQRAAVCEALAERPRVADNVSAVLAFVSGKLGFSGSVIHRGVWCSDVREAVGYAAWRGPVIGTATIKLDSAQRHEIAESLARAFPPA
jgi:hypothetical protein